MCYFSYSPSSRAYSHVASPPVRSHGSSPLIQEITDSCAISLHIPDRLPSHAGYSLIQDITDSHAASPPVQDIDPLLMLVLLLFQTGPTHR